MRNRIGTALLIVGLAAVAAPALAESPKEHAAKLMKKLATDKKADERAAAAKELGEMGAWDAVPALATALKDPSADVRAGAAYALVKLKDKAKDAAPALKEALADRDYTVRYNAVVALSNMEAATPAELAAPIRSLLDGSHKDDRDPGAWHTRAVSWLVGLGFEDPTARKTILDTLEQQTPDVRLQILEEMGQQKTMRQSGPWKAEVVAHLIPMVTADRDPKIRYQAIDRLREAKPVSAPVGEALLKAVDDPDPKVAMEAARALGDLYDTRRDPLPNTAIAHLTQKLKSTDPEQRASAANALSGFNDGYSRDKVIPVLTAALLNDKEPAVRLAVLGALDEFPDDVPSLLKALKTDADPKVKATICTGWSKARDLKFLLAKHLEEALATLEAARGDANAGVKAACEAALTTLRK